MKKVCVVGCGYWGKNLVRNFNEIGSLSAICDVDEKVLKSFQKMYGDVAIYTDYSEMLKDSKIDAVVISTPAETHYALARDALFSDKDVFVEKPIALYLKDGKDLVSLAKEKNKILMVGHILEYHPAIRKLKEIIDNDDLGNINYIYSNRLNLGKIRYEENILWSFAPHDISVILHLLDEMPEEVCARGGNYLNKDVADVTVTSLNFSSGVKAHIFVSWLHPYKEQKLVVIGDKAMAVFNDVSPKDKLLLYKHEIDMKGNPPVSKKNEAEIIPVKDEEPLKVECQHFIRSIEQRKPPKTDGVNGLKVLNVLETCQESLDNNGKLFYVSNPGRKDFFVHKSSYVDEDVSIGEGTKIWHFSHVLKDSKIGEGCSIGQNVMIGPNVTIGNNVKIQNNVSVYDGVVLEDDVFCGPSMVFTNVMNPRSHWPRKDEYKKTVVKKGASLGANSTIVCGITIGKYAFVGAGALVNKDVPDYALVYGIPAKIQGWMCYCGNKLEMSESVEKKGTVTCPECERIYKKERQRVTEVDKK